MAQNNTTPWPPTPESGEVAVQKPFKPGRAGKVSLTLGLTGWGIIGLLAGFWSYIALHGSEETALFESFLLGALLIVTNVMLVILAVGFLAGLVAGIVGRRTTAGKWGIALALVFLAVGYWGLRLWVKNF